MIAAIYARLNTKAVERALQTQAYRLCSLVPEPVVVWSFGWGRTEQA